MWPAKFVSGGGSRGFRAPRPVDVEVKLAPAGPHKCADVSGSALSAHCHLAQPIHRPKLTQLRRDIAWLLALIHNTSTAVHSIVGKRAKRLRSLLGRLGKQELCKFVTVTSGISVTEVN